MAKVQGIQEKLHWPLYDAFVVPEQNGHDGGADVCVGDGQTGRAHPALLRRRAEQDASRDQPAGVRTTAEPQSLRGPRDARGRVADAAPRQGRQRRRTSAHDPDTDNVLADLIYNSVTSLLVGEKTMIEMPTYYFPAGAGVSPGTEGLPSHGQPDPMATFRFSEPVQIEPNQNFRVEILFPQGVPERQAAHSHHGPQRLGDATGPLRLWVVLDGYLTRDVQ